MNDVLRNESVALRFDQPPKRTFASLYCIFPGDMGDPPAMLETLTEKAAQGAGIGMEHQRLVCINEAGTMRETAPIAEVHVLPPQERFVKQSEPE